MPDKKEKVRILFLCTGNSCRSQMAEGLARKLKGEIIEAHSAGTRPTELNPLAVKAMHEIGIDISGHTGKSVAQLNGLAFDYVVTVCDGAHQACPHFPGPTKVVHVGFDDPPALSRQAANEAEALPHYRRVRDEIRTFVEKLPQALAGK